jgi:glycerol uptake facilitator-like aquaporin
MNFCAYTAEFVGTFALIFVGVGGIAGATLRKYEPAAV